MLPGAIVTLPTDPVLCILFSSNETISGVTNITWNSRTLFGNNYVRWALAMHAVSVISTSGLSRKIALLGGSASCIGQLGQSCACSKPVKSWVWTLCACSECPVGGGFAFERKLRLEAPSYRLGWLSTRFEWVNLVADETVLSTGAFCPSTDDLARCMRTSAAVRTGLIRPEVLQ